MEAKAKQPWEIVADFVRELEKPDVFLRTDQPNALGSFNTQSWGDTGKRAISAALRDALSRVVPEINV